MYVYMYVYTYVCIHIDMCIYIYARTYVYTHIYIYIYIIFFRASDARAAESGNPDPPSRARDAPRAGSGNRQLFAEEIHELT